MFSSEIVLIKHWLYSFILYGLKICLPSESGEFPGRNIYTCSRNFFCMKFFLYKALSSIRVGPISKYIVRQKKPCGRYLDNHFVSEVEERYNPTPVEDAVGKYLLRHE